MATMKAVRLHEYGEAEVLKFEDAPRPEPGEAEVLVRVHATSVNPIDWKVRAGHLKSLIPYPLPLIPGWDVSGVVEALGPGASRFRPGDEVYGRPDIARNGAYAEYLAVREAELARKPASLDHPQAACVPLAALTAWQALNDAAGLAAGQRVLIHGGAGGVGHFAVQLARLKGAGVTATASGRNQEFLRELGADRPVDYETSRFEDVARDIDVVLDSFSGEIRARSWKVLKKGGILVSILGPPPAEEEAAAHGVRATMMWVRGDADQLARIAALLDAGRIRVHVDAVFPLAEAARAHQLSATGHVRGKIALEVARPA
jgi:NADPH:quinone reductase-like Zn-dependent oxidoreductase